MIPLALSVLGASVVGSPHCAGMCGGIAGCCSGVGCSSTKAAVATGSAYHATRLVSYATVGAIAGAFGSALEEGGAMVGIQRIAAIAAGVTVALIGTSMLLSAAGIGTRTWKLPGIVQRAISAIHRAASTMAPLKRSILLGLATPLLPCGWLWAFAAVAAGTASAAEGAVVMAMFWLGTVPILVAVGSSISVLGGSKRRALAGLAGVSLIAVGIYTASARADLSGLIAMRLSEQAARADGGPQDPAKVVPACCVKEGGTP